MTFFDIVDGQSLPGGSNQAVMENGTLKIGTLHELSVLEDHISSVPVQCAVLARDRSWKISVICKSDNATLTAYGERSTTTCIYTSELLHFFMQVLLRHHQTSHQHSPAAML